MKLFGLWIRHLIQKYSNKRKHIDGYGNGNVKDVHVGTHDKFGNTSLHPSPRMSSPD